MKILAAIKREEKKLERQLGKLQRQLNGIRVAASALNDSTNKEIKSVKKHVLSAAGRAAIAKAARKRWAKVRKQAKKAVSYRRPPSADRVPTSSLEVLVSREVVVASP
jgi:t-SNARE complex subunit (syntaxin)